MSGDRDYRAYAGLELEEVAGVEIRVLEVAAGSPASEAGLRVGAVVHKVDGESLDSLQQFVRLFKTNPPNGKLVLETMLDGQSQTAEMTLWARF